MNRKRWLRVGMPIVASLAAHVVLLALVGSARWEYSPTVRGGAERAYAVSVAEAAPAPPETLAWPGPEETATPLSEIADWPEYAGDPGAEADVSLSSLSQLAAETLADGERTGGGFGIGDGGASAVLGLGGGAGAPGAGGGALGEGLGGGAASAGVWDVRAGGKRFVYVVDFSGSIIVAVEELKRELKRSVGKLGPQQAFNVIIFYSTAGADRNELRTERFAAQLQSATIDNKRDFFTWIDSKEPQGATEPLSAMQQALRLEPDAVFLFSDGWFEDDVEVAIARANATINAQVHCLVFDELLLQEAGDVPRLTAGARRLQRIAETSGGQFKVVTARDLR